MKQCLSHLTSVVLTLLACAVFWFRSNNSNVCNSCLLLHMHFYIETEKMLWIRSNNSNFCLHLVLFWLDFLPSVVGFFYFHGISSPSFPPSVVLIPLGNSVMLHIPDKSTPILWLVDTSDLTKGCVTILHYFSVFQATGWDQQCTSTGAIKNAERNSSGVLSWAWRAQSFCDTKYLNL